MAITVLEILQKGPAGLSARFRHEEFEFVAFLVGEVEPTTRENLIFEMDFETVVSARILTRFEDESSLICQGSDGNVIIRGRVHQVISDDDEATWIDLYLMNGPEFFLLRMNDAGIETPAEGAGLEVVVHGLRIYLSAS